MSLLERLHEEYYTHDGELVLFRCKECGYTTLSLGFIHAHVEQHWPYLKWFVHFLPWTGEWDDWMQHTEVLRVDAYSETELSEVEGL